MLKLVLPATAVANLIQLTMAVLAWKNWNRHPLGMRGEGWFGLLWAVYGLGMVFGIWLYCADPG
jgi:hypothetical protein